MGIKGIIVAFFLIITVIFSFQNMQNITLVFFGINTISLPLSFAVLIFVFLGLISSFFIQFLGYLSNSKSSNDSASKGQYSPPPPPSPPTLNNSQYSRSREKISTKKAKIPQIEINEEPFYQDLEEEIKPIFTENKTVIQSENLATDQENYDISFIPEEELKIENLEIKKDTNNKPFNIEEKEVTNIEENLNYSAEIKEELVRKPRLASPYSYKTREKTEIIPRNYQDNPPKRKPPLPDKNNDIYTASYRIITPASDEYPNDYLSDDDNDDDDWDF